MCVSWGIVPLPDPLQNQFTFITELQELQHTLHPNSKHVTTPEDRRQYKHRRRLIGKDYEKRRGLTCKAHRKNTENRRKVEGGKRTETELDYRGYREREEREKIRDKSRDEGEKTANWQVRRRTTLLDWTGLDWTGLENNTH